MNNKITYDILQYYLYDDIRNMVMRYLRYPKIYSYLRFENEKKISWNEIDHYLYDDLRSIVMKYVYKKFDYYHYLKTYASYINILSSLSGKKYLKY